MDTQEEKHIGQIIKVLRTASGLKQKDLAQRAGIKPNYLSLVESGRREPSLQVLRSISKGLNVPMTFLFWEASTKEETGDPKGRNLVNRIRQLLLELECLRLSDTADQNVANVPSKS